jgi:hypothetical protein
MTPTKPPLKKPRGKVTKLTAEEIKRLAEIADADKQAAQAAFSDDADLMAMLEAKTETGK